MQTKRYNPLTWIQVQAPVAEVNLTTVLADPEKLAKLMDEELTKRARRCAFVAYKTVRAYDFTSEGNEVPEPDWFELSSAQHGMWTDVCKGVLAEMKRHRENGVPMAQRVERLAELLYSHRKYQLVMLGTVDVRTAPWAAVSQRVKARARLHVGAIVSCWAAMLEADGSVHDAVAGEYLYGVAENKRDPDAVIEFRQEVANGS